jgi:hypothetical protein
MDKLPNIKVSVYRNVNDSKSQETVSLLRWLEGFPRLNPTVDRIRLEPDKKKRGAMKEKLPAITASGIFHPERKDENLIQHSGFIALDFDGLADQLETKQLLANIENVFYCGLSVSGRGLWALIPLQHPEHHRRQYEALEADFKALGLVTDPRCINVGRLRYYSYDPQPVFNLEAVPYSKIAPEPAKILPRFEPRDNDNTALEKLISKIEATQTDITSDYGDWLKLAGALASIYGEAGRGLFHRISRFYPDYKPRETDRQYSACLRNRPGFSEGMIFSIAKKHNILLIN